MAIRIVNIPGKTCILSGSERIDRWLQRPSDEVGGLYQEMRNDVRGMRHKMRDGARGISQLKLRFNSQQHRIEPPISPNPTLSYNKAREKLLRRKILILSPFPPRPERAPHGDVTETSDKLGHSVNESLVKVFYQKQDVSSLAMCWK